MKNKKKTDWLLTTIVSCIGIINVPYQGLMEAFEKFWQLAIVDIINTFLKLFAVLALILYTGNNALRLYATLLSLLTFSSFIQYQYLCYKQWKDIVRLKFYKDKDVCVYGGESSTLEEALYLSDSFIAKLESITHQTISIDTLEDASNKNSSNVI